MKCPGCRCVSPSTNRKCGCCNRWPDVLACVSCKLLGRFDTNLLLTTNGPMHDRCWAMENASAEHFDAMAKAEAAAEAHVEERVREAREARRHVRT